MRTTTPSRITQERRGEMIVLRKPSPSDKDVDRLLIVNNLDAKYLSPRGVTLADEVLERSEQIGPMGLAVYLGVCYLTHHEKEVNPTSVAKFVGCHKVTAKRELRRLTMMGIVEYDD